MEICSNLFAIVLPLILKQKEYVFDWKYCLLFQTAIEYNRVSSLQTNLLLLLPNTEMLSYKFGIATEGYVNNVFSLGNKFGRKRQITGSGITWNTCTYDSRIGMNVIVFGKSVFFCKISRLNFILIAIL